MKESFGKYLFLIGSFIFWIFLALFSSKLIVDNVTSGHHYSNAVFSLMQNAREFLIIIAIVATTLLWCYVHNNKGIHLISVSFIGLLTAGIMANCHERIVLGYVRDYIHLNFINFPVFNVADVFITIGVIALIAILLIYKR